MDGKKEKKKVEEKRGRKGRDFVPVVRIH